MKIFKSVFNSEAKKLIRYVLGLIGGMIVIKYGDIIYAIILKIQNLFN